MSARPSTSNSPTTSSKNMPSATADATKDTVADSKPSDNQVPTIKQPDDVDSKDPPPPTNAPLAPPPKPTQTQNGGSGGGEPDYFAGQHNQSHLSKEPNPFENAFGNPAETPGKTTQLPGFTSLTSPASLLPVNTPGWPGSLRSGPLSPAMLTGPTSSNDYFNSDHHFAGSFPTPNESSLRSGLTPGGGGSMFPQPSPSSQALYNQLQSGGATPGTLDFHRTALNARAQQANNNNANNGHSNNYQGSNNNGMPQNGGSTSQAVQNPNIQPDLDSKPYNPSNQQQQDGQDPFSSHQTNDAANGLFMLAQAGGQRNGNKGFAMPQQPQQQQSYQQQQQQQQQENNNNANNRNAKNSIASTMSGSTEVGQGDYSDGSVDAKPPTRSTRGKKGSTGKAATNGSNKRKTDDTPSRPGNGNVKRQRANTSQSMMDEEPEDDDEMMDSPDQEMTGADGKKMTDEEKRKNFLERNRVAALKCRQRKKQWLANLQQKVEIFSTENDALAATVTQLREEIVGLKTLLLAHKDCPVSQAQGISSMAIQQIAGDGGHSYNNPYGMAMGHGGQGQMQAGMQRS